MEVEIKRFPTHAFLGDMYNHTHIKLHIDYKSEVQ